MPREATTKAKTEPAPENSYTVKWHGEADDAPLKKWLADKTLPEVGTGLLSGQWGTFKTFAALDLAGAVMTKGFFAGRKINRQGGVLFIAAEGQDEIKVRLAGIAREKVSAVGDAVKIDPARMPFAWIEKCPRLTADDALAQITKVAASVREKLKATFGLELALVIIDTLSPAAAFKDANDQAEAQRVMDVLNGLAKAVGALVMAVDHFGKDVTTGTRGSSAKEGAADAVLALLAERDLAGNVSNPRMAIRKVRGAPTGQEIPFTMRTVTVDENKEGPVTTLVVDWQEPAAELMDGEPPRTKRMSDGAAIALRALRKTIADVGEQRTANDIPRGVRGATVEQWRTRSYLAGICDSDELKTRQKAFKRAREALLADGTVVEWNGFVWIAKD